MTDRDVARLKGVHPKLVEKLVRVYEAMDKLGKPMFVIEGLRTDERQRALYALGRTSPGQIVTYKDGVVHKSRHQPGEDGLGRAVDSAFIPNGIRDPFSPRWPWEEYGRLLEAEGLLWGGRWKMADLPHAELPLPLALEV